MKIKHYISICITMLIFSLSTAAHADFRKAVDALINKDGQKMLAQVKNSVSEKDYNGFLLFVSALEIDAVTSKMDDSIINSAFHGLYYADRRFHKNKLAILEVILSKQQQLELFVMLDMVAATSNEQSLFRWIMTKRYLEAINNSGLPLDADYLANHQETLAKLDALAKRGYSPASLKMSFIYQQNKSHLALQSLISAAEQNNSYAQLILAQAFLGRAVYPSCNVVHETAKTDCLNADQKQGEYWLKRAIELNRMQDLPIVDLSVTTGDWVYQNKALGEASVSEAYFWYKQALAFNLTEYILINPQSIVERISNLPLQEADFEITPSSRLLSNLSKRSKVSQPVITLMRNRNFDSAHRDIEDVFFNYWIDIYPDGKVNLLVGARLYGEENTESVYKLSKKELENILEEIKKLNIESWNNSTQVLHPPIADGSTSADYVVTVNNNHQATTRLLHVNRMDIDIPKEAKQVVSGFAKIIEIIDQAIAFESVLCGASNAELYKQNCNSYHQSLKNQSEGDYK